MIDFENLKNSYISVVQWGLSARVGCEESKRGNEVLHKFCEDLIDNSNYSNSDKAMMKHELEVIKEALSKEIECFYQKMKSRSIHQYGGVIREKRRMGRANV